MVYDSKTKKITTTAMLCAVAYVVVAVGRIPVVLFLKYDPKDIIITLGGLIWGPMTPFIVSVIVSLIEMVTISENGVLGCIMNIISTCSFACTASVIYKKKRTLSGAGTGLVTGSLMMVLVMLLWNYLIAPIYMGYPREAVAELLVPADIIIQRNHMRNCYGTDFREETLTYPFRQCDTWTGDC